MHRGIRHAWLCSVGQLILSSHSELVVIHPALLWCPRMCMATWPCAQGDRQCCLFPVACWCPASCSWLTGQLSAVACHMWKALVGAYPCMGICSGRHDGLCINHHAYAGLKTVYVCELGTNRCRMPVNVTTIVIMMMNHISWCGNNPTHLPKRCRCL